MQYRDHQNYRAEQTLNRWNQELHLRRDQITDILTIFNQYCRLNENKGISFERILITITIEYMRNRNIYISMTNLTEIFQEEERRINRTTTKFYNTLRRALNREEKMVLAKNIKRRLGQRQINQTRTIIEEMFNRLDAQCNFTMPARQQILQLIERTEEAFFIGKNRGGILGGIIYYVQSVSTNQICRTQEFTQKFLAEQLHASEMTIRNTYNYLRRKNPDQKKKEQTKKKEVKQARRGENHAADL